MDRQYVHTNILVGRSLNSHLFPIPFSLEELETFIFGIEDKLTWGFFFKK